MKKITCNYKGSPMRLRLKDVNGKEINDFAFGKVLSESDILNKEEFKTSYEKGLIRAFISKGWILEGEVNVKNKIIGTPEPMKKIDIKNEETVGEPDKTVKEDTETQGVTGDEADSYVKGLSTEEKIEKEVEKMGAKVEKPEKKTSKKGRPKNKKVVEAIEDTTVEAETETTEENPKETEDDFL